MIQIVTTCHLLSPIVERQPHSIQRTNEKQNNAVAYLINFNRLNYCSKRHSNFKMKQKIKSNWHDVRVKWWRITVNNEIDWPAKWSTERIKEKREKEKNMRAIKSNLHGKKNKSIGRFESARVLFMFINTFNSKCDWKCHVERISPISNDCFVPK